MVFEYIMGGNATLCTTYVPQSWQPEPERKGHETDHILHTRYGKPSKLLELDKISPLPGIRVSSREMQTLLNTSVAMVAYSE